MHAHAPEGKRGGLPLAAAEDIKTCETLPVPARRVLVAEDNAVTNDLLRLLLTERGHDVDIVADGEEALRASFDARQSLVKLRAESETLKDELAALDAARADADSALEDLRRHYAEGVVRAPVGGTVGTGAATKGDVFRPGDMMLSIHSGEAYVLAYLPRNYLFEIRPGMEVTVSNGRLSATGTISDILPVADALPEEFQNTFQPRDRNRLARIRFDETPAFALQEKVRISRRYF